MSEEKVQIIQKIDGFLVALEGDEAVVCFVKNEECIEMVVPAKNLKRNNITKKDQPFEYTESEVFKNGCWYQCTAYKPLCLADDYKVASVKLSDESRKQMEEILDETPDAINKSSLGERFRIANRDLFFCERG